VLSAWEDTRHGQEFRFALSIFPNDLEVCCMGKFAFGKRLRMGAHLTRVQSAIGFEDANLLLIFV